MLHTVRSKFFLASLFKRAFVVAFVFVAFASGLFWLDFFRGYHADVTVLIIAQPGMPETSEDVAENAVELTQTLAFYERVLADNDLIDDDVEGYAPDARKTEWHKKVSVKRQGESGVLLIRAQGDTPEQAKRLAKQTAQTLFTVAGFYYDVKTEIDMRIIDGPLAAYALDRPFLFVMTSILSGLMLTGVFFSLLQVVPAIFSRRARRITAGERAPVVERAHPEFAVGEAVPWIDPKKFIPSRPQALSFENMLQHTIRPVSTEEHPSVTVAHAPAPVNLPTVENEKTLPMMVDEADLPFTFEHPTEERSQEPTVEKKQDSPLDFPVRGEHAIEPLPIVSSATPSVLADRERGEPTVEEYKRRLNALLSGGR